MIPDPRHGPESLTASEVMGRVWTGDFSNSELRAIRRAVNHRIEWLKERGKWPY